MAHHGKRLANRLRTRLPARLITLDGERRVVLQDLSCTGAGIIRPDLPRDCGQAVLQWYGYEAFGTIRWLTGRHCGIEFDTPIPEAWVIATRSHDARERLPDERELSRRRARDWVAGVVRI